MVARLPFLLDSTRFVANIVSTLDKNWMLIFTVNCRDKTLLDFYSIFKSVEGMSCLCLLTTNIFKSFFREWRSHHSNKTRIHCFRAGNACTKSRSLSKKNKNRTVPTQGLVHFSKFQPVIPAKMYLPRVGYARISNFYRPKSICV